MMINPLLRIHRLQKTLYGANKNEQIKTTKATPVALFNPLFYLLGIHVHHVVRDLIAETAF